MFLVANCQASVILMILSKKGFDKSRTIGRQLLKHLRHTLSDGMIAKCQYFDRVCALVYNLQRRHFQHSGISEKWLHGVVKIIFRQQNLFWQFNKKNAGNYEILIRKRILFFNCLGSCNTHPVLWASPFYISGDPGSI